MICAIMRRRGFVISCSIVCALAGAAWVGYWLWAAAAFQAGMAEWTDHQRARGYQIAYQGPEIGGFPLRLTARFAALEVVAPNGGRWRGPPVTGAAALWQPFTIDLAFPGRLRWTPPAKTGSKAAKADVEVETAEARVKATLRTDGHLDWATAELFGLSLEHAKAGTLTAESLWAGFRPLDDPGGQGAARISLQLEARDLVLPASAEVPLGRDVESVVLDAIVIGEIPGGGPRAALQRWRADGGALEVKRLALVWGSLTLAADGRLTLDERLRPQGALSARVRGLAETLDRLAAARVIEPGVAVAAKFALLALAGGGGSEVVVPITLRDGRLYLGPVPLLSISPVL